MSSQASWMKQRKLMLLLSVSIGGRLSSCTISKSLPLTLSLPLSPPIHSKSQKAKGHRHNGDEEVLHPPSPTPATLSKTHTRTQEKHATAPVTYRRAPAARTRTPSCFSLAAFFEFLPMYLAGPPVTPPPGAISLSLSLSLSQTS